MDTNNTFGSLDRRAVLKGTAALLGGGSVALGRAGARSGGAPVATLRGSPSAPLSRTELRQAAETFVTRADTPVARSKRRQLRQYDVSEFGEIVTFNVALDDGAPSIYYGIARDGETSVDLGPGRQRDAGDAVTGRGGDVGAFHDVADAHIEAARATGTSRPAVATGRQHETESNDEFDRVSDVRMDYVSKEIQPSEVQFRIDEQQWNDNDDILVYHTRVDQRLADHIDMYWQGSLLDAEITHDWDKKDGARLEDWSPSPNHEQEGYGTASVSYNSMGPSVSYSYEFRNETITVSDDSPFGEETSRALVDIPRYGPDRYRAQSASMGSVEEFSPTGKDRWAHMGTIFQGGFLYPTNCGGGLCQMDEEPIDLRYYFEQDILDL